jgi:hypothetical protein
MRMGDMTAITFRHFAKKPKNLYLDIFFISYLFIYLFIFILTRVIFHEKYIRL